MTSKDIFDTPFDEGTIAKLEIFEKYFEAWLPTFIMQQKYKPIQVFDLFAGIGYDQTRKEGSPIRILNVIAKFRTQLIKQKKKIKVYLNDKDKSKYEALKTNVENRIKELSLNSIVEIKITDKPFKECLMNYNKELSNGCNLLFIDQNGFSEVDESVFKYLINLDTTDFMFFISSSYIHRFAVLPEVKKFHSKFDFEKIKNSKRSLVHKVICEEFYKYVPNSIKEKVYIFPFSIMKEDKNNVYGIIFVTKHILGADKFLETVWKKNIINGNANFDIDDDFDKTKMDYLIPSIKKLTKIEKFQQDLHQKILKGELKNNQDVYLYTIKQGHIHQHANIEIKEMRKNNLINYDEKSPLINYKQIVKKRRIIKYEVKNENDKN
jgi:three-Cys-motif partner protein